MTTQYSTYHCIKTERNYNFSAPESEAYVQYIQREGESERQRDPRGVWVIKF